MRRLEMARVPYRAIVYDDAGAFHRGEEAASLVGAPVELVYKTLVVLRDPPRGRPLIVLVPSTGQLNLKALAHALGEKRLRMATRREAEQLTGMRAGAITALGLREGAFDVYVDARAISQERMYVSGGAFGIELELCPADFLRLTGARPVALAG